MGHDLKINLKNENKKNSQGVKCSLLTVCFIFISFYSVLNIKTYTFQVIDCT